MASVARLTGSLVAAEDAAQDACAAALVQWPLHGRPDDPRGWIVATARHKALDQVRRETRRRSKELAAVEEEWRALEGAVTAPDADELALVFLCCHPALDPAVRVALTLRSVCGLATAEVAAVFLVPEATMAKRLTRARRKIKDARIPLRTPAPQALAERLDAVLRVVYLVFTEGHRTSRGEALVRDDLCDLAVRLATGLARLLPDEPEIEGLLALLLLTRARRPARVDADGRQVLLADQDRSRWDHSMIEEGEAVLERALRRGRPGPYQLHAAIAACHSTARRYDDTDWRQIALLYGELVRLEPSPVVEANRAVAIAMARGPGEGLRILEAVARSPQMTTWPQLHLARADLLRRMGDVRAARDAYRQALRLDPSPSERTFAERLLRELGSTDDAQPTRP